MHISRKENLRNYLSFSSSIFKDQTKDIYLYSLESKNLPESTCQEITGT